MSDSRQKRTHSMSTGPQRPPPEPADPQPSPGTGSRAGQHPLDRWQDLINQRIEEAMQTGAFDNLSGRGRPLNLERNPFEPEGMEMANKLLKDNDLVPAWIADREEVLDAIEVLRAEMGQVWTRHQDAYRTESGWLTDEHEQEWRHHLQQWQRRIEELNRRIDTINLSLPIWRLEVLKLRLDRELQRLGAPDRLIT